MTVVHPNHIVGINSITVQTGDSLSVHKADGSLIRTIVSNTGVSTFHAIEVSKGGGDLTVGISTLFADNSTGRIGIGTDIPDSNLHIWSHSDDTRIEIDSQGFKRNNYIGVHAADNLEIAADEDNLGGSSSIRLRVDATEKMRIDSSGRVGINSTSPTSKFEVIAADYDCVTLTTIESGTNGPQLELHHLSASPAASDTVGQVRFSSRDSAGNKDLMSKIETIVDDPTSGQETGSLQFGTRGLGSFNSIFRLKNRGSALAPSYTTDDHNGIILDVYNTGNPYPRYMNIIAKSAGDTASNMLFWTEAVGGSPTEKLRIDSNGYVGVKMDTPHLYYAKDLVVGAIAQGGITIKSPNTTDTNYLMFADGTSGNERYRGYIGYAHNTGADNGEHMQFAASGGTGLMRFYADGIALGGETATANRLNDYEEGTFTAAITVDTGTNPSQNAYTHRYAYYRKIGKMVHIRVDIQFGAVSSAGSGNAVISGLPYVNSNQTNAYGVTFSSGYSPNWGTNNSPTQAYINTNSSEMYLMKNSVSDGVQYVQVANIVNGTRVICGATYMTDV